MSAQVGSLARPTQKTFTLSNANRQLPIDRTTVDVLITGASGFIGRHVAKRLLDENLRVGLVVRRPMSVEDLRTRGAKVFNVDFLKPEALQSVVSGCRTVIHLAAMTSALTKRELFAVNADGTRLLAEACQQQPRPPHFVYVSSVAASGPCPAGAIRREQDYPAPVSNYGRSKLAGELAAAAVADCVPTTIVRPGIVFGPGNREMLPMFRAIKYLAMHPVVGWTSPRLSMSYIEDTVDTILQASEYGSRLPSNSMSPMERLTSGRGVYFACAPEYPDYAQLGKIIRGHMHRSWAPVIPLLGPTPWIAAGINQFFAYCRRRPDAFNVDKIREAVAPSWACSCDRIEGEFGLHPSRTISEAIEHTVQWYQQHRWL